MATKKPFLKSVALITGGGSGIGRLLALGAFRRGAIVVIWDLDRDAAEAVRREITEAGGTAYAYRVNVAKPRQVARTAARVLSEVGPVTILVNNAGVVTGKDLLDAEEEAIRRTFDVNTLALFWVTRAFLPAMIERRRGMIVTIASAAGFVAVARQTDYSASKFAAVGFTEALRAELRTRKTGVRTLLVAPYYINTGMFEGVQTRFPRLLPIMEPDYAVDQILRAIERGSAQLILPRSIRFTAALRLLPVSVSDRLLDWAGLNRGMDHFVGRSGPAEESADPGAGDGARGE